MATTIVTLAMRKRANELLTGATTWTRGRRKADGLALVIFPSSKAGHAYYTSQIGCTCPSYLYRGACCHIVAVRAEAWQVQEQAARPLRTYENLFGLDEAF